MWVIIGYGSTLHGDDGLGGIVAGQVRSRAGEDLDVEVLAGNQLMPEWSEPISRAEGVIFVDAGTDVPAGQVSCIALHPAPSAAPGIGAFTHYPTPQTLLDGARTLYGRAPDGWLYVVGGANFELGEAISDAVQQALPRVTDLILERCKPYA